MSKYQVIKKVVKDEQYKLLDTLECKDISQARRVATQKYYNSINPVKEQLIVVEAEGYNKYYKDKVESK